jgi:hypothetical protein
MSDFFSKIEDRRSAEISVIDRKYAVEIRNHIVQLFRKAQAKAPGLTGVLVGMGTATPSGTYETTYEDTGETVEVDACDWKYRGNVDPKHQEITEFFKVVDEYSDKYMELPCIGDITLDDLESRSAKKTELWKRRSNR